MSTSNRDDQQPVLEIEDLNISFFVRAGEIPAVMDFSCKVMPGETMGLVGESGCGKSTVALGIMRDMGNRGKIVGGKIKFKGRDMGEMSDDELRDIRGSKIAMIYQEPMASLNPAMKIGRQLMEVPLIHEDVSEQEAYDRALEMVHKVKLPDPARVMDAYPHQISGGQQQRIVIAMALMSKPDLLLLDEPTTALDVTVEAGIVELVKELGRTTGTSMLFISHNLGLILETCDRITVMYSGEAVETGSVHEVFDRMRHPYTQGLFNSIPLPGADKNAKPLLSIPGQLPLPMARPHGCNFGPRCEHYIEDLCNAHPVKMQSVPGEPDHRSRCERIEQIDWDKEAERKVVTDPVEPGRVVLDIRDLKKYYDVAANKMFGGGDTRTVKANETITFQAREAETVAIVGESGCGKSTLAKVLLGLETATSGSVMLDGKEIANTEVNDRGPNSVASLQMVFQNPFDTLNPSHSVGSQIIRTLEKFDIGTPGADRQDRMLKLLDLVKLPRAFADRMPRQLSGGQKQRIGVARAFAGEPKVVVADEPVSALDVSVQAAVTELLMEIQREAKTTMLFISHDLSVVRYIADRVVVMYLGHIVEQGTTDDIFAPPYHPYTEALLSAIPIADTSVEKKHIVLDGDIPSALNPPSGCPFQTRCPRKAQVPGDLCETTVPPVRDLGAGHQVKCHLSDADLSIMEPVIVLGGTKATKTRTVVTQGLVEDGQIGSTSDDDRNTVTAASAALGGAVLSRGQADSGEASAHLPDGQLSGSEIGIRRAAEASAPAQGSDIALNDDGSPRDRSSQNRAASDVGDTPKPKSPRKPKPRMPKKIGLSKGDKVAASAAVAAVAAVGVAKVAKAVAKPKAKAATKAKTVTTKAPAKTKVAPKRATTKAPAKGATAPVASAKPATKTPAKTKVAPKAKTPASKPKTQAKATAKVTTKATAKTPVKAKAPAAATAKAPAKVAAKAPAKAKAETTSKAPAKTKAKVTGGTAAMRAALLSAAASRAPAKPKTAASKTVRATATKTTRTPRAVSNTPRKTSTGAPERMAKPTKPDDLTMIAGVGPKLATTLNGLGVYTFEQVSKWKKAERDWVDNHLSFRGRIEREDWVKQAKALAKGGRDEYVRVFGKEPR